MVEHGQHADPLAVRLEGVGAALCAAALRESDPSVLLAAAHEDEFRATRYAPLWKAMRESFERLGRLTAHELLAQGGFDVQALVEARRIEPDPVSVLAEFRALSALAKARAITASQAKAYAAAPASREEIVALLQSHMLHLSTVIDELADEGGEEGLAEVAERWIASLQEPHANWRLSTGIDDLDYRIGGGMPPGTLTIPIARSGHGKSTLAITAAVAASRAGLRTLYVSREMPDLELFGRFIACEEDEPLESIKRSVRSGNEDVIARVRALGIRPMLMRDDVGHIDRIGAIVRRERIANHPFRLVVLDYLQHFDAPGDEQHQRLEAVAYGAKMLAMDCECVVLMPAQPNREGSKKDGLPSMHEIRGSSAIENAADVIVSMEKLKASSDSAARLLMRVEKARNARTGDLEGDYWLGAGTFRVSQTRSENGNVEYL